MARGALNDLRIGETCSELTQINLTHHRLYTLTISMSPPVSSHFIVKDIAGAGRSVVASEPISKDTVVLRSQPPAACVVFHQYRKEVCAHCFHYDRGRTLRYRINWFGKVFCSEECQYVWLKKQGELGRSGWEQLQLFLQAKSKAITNVSGLPLLAPKPEFDEIRSKWTDTEFETTSPSHHKSSQGSKNKLPPFNHILSKSWTQAVEPDVLNFLLSGIILHFNHPERYDSTILPLAMDETPYRSTPDLDAHVNSYLQLSAIAPEKLLTSITPEICQTLINAASHNSFGIHSGSEDGDEYMGYALYPDASYFNHSCSPNILKARIGNIWEFRASRDIEVEEECCITYLGGDEKELTVEQRRQRLKEHWGFECMCARCKHESASR